MSEITQRLFMRHLQATPTTYVQRMRNGTVTQEGVGIRFWFRGINTEVSEVPLDERELPLVFHARTQDFQDVTVQASITYRIESPADAVSRIDFSIDTADGLWRSTPLEQLGADSRLVAAGLEIMGVRVLAVRPNKDLEIALQTPVAEDLQEEADRARFERRASAAEHERAIRENELQNEIEIARRTEELVSQEGLNERRRTTEVAEASKIKAQAAARDSRVSADARANALELIGAAQAGAERASLEAYAELSEATMLGLALKELAGNIPNIDTLVLAPDMLASLLARLGVGPSDGRPEAEEAA